MVKRVESTTEENLTALEHTLDAARATRRGHYTCHKHDAMCDGDHPCQGCAAEAIEQTPELTADLEAIRQQVRPPWRP